MHNNEKGYKLAPRFHIIQKGNIVIHMIYDEVIHRGGVIKVIEGGLLQDSCIVKYENNVEREFYTECCFDSTVNPKPYEWFNPSSYYVYVKE